MAFTNFMTPWIERTEVVGVGLLVVTLACTSVAFDGSSLIGRALFDRRRTLITSDIIRGGTVRGGGLKVYPLYIETPLGAFGDHRRSRTRVILVKLTLREKG